QAPETGISKKVFKPLVPRSIVVASMQKVGSSLRRILAVGTFVLFGSVIVPVLAQAANSAGWEAESGTLVNATTANDSQASGGKYAVFGNAQTPQAFEF